MTEMTFSNFMSQWIGSGKHRTIILINDRLRAEQRRDIMYMKNHKRKRIRIFPTHTLIDNSNMSDGVVIILMAQPAIKQYTK